MLMHSNELDVLKFSGFVAIVLTENGVDYISTHSDEGKLNKIYIIKAVLFHPFQKHSNIGKKFWEIGRLASKQSTQGSQVSLVKKRDYYQRCFTWINTFPREQSSLLNERSEFVLHGNSIILVKNYILFFPICVQIDSICIWRYLLSFYLHGINSVS